MPVRPVVRASGYLGAAGRDVGQLSCQRAGNGRFSSRHVVTSSPRRGLEVRAGGYLACHHGLDGKE